MMPNAKDRMLRSSEVITRQDNQGALEEEKRLKRELRKQQRMLKARYRNVPSPSGHPLVPSDAIAQREEAWEK